MEETKFFIDYDNKVYKYKISKKIGSWTSETNLVEVLEPESLRSEVCVVKIIKPIRDADHSDYDQFDDQLKHRKKIEHKNLIQFFGGGITYNDTQKEEDEWPPKIHLLMEFCPDWSLEELLVDKGPIPSHLAHHYVLQIVRGLKYLHLRDLIHEDIKPTNLLLSSNKWIIKVGGFGERLPIKQSSFNWLAPSVPESITYKSPELIRYLTGDNIVYVTKSTDVWSVGCVLRYMLLGIRPRYDKRIIDNQIFPTQEITATDSEDTSSVLENTIKHCLQLKPENRPDVKSLRETLRRVTCKSLIKKHEEAMIANGKPFKLGLFYNLKANQMASQGFRDDLIVKYKETYVKRLVPRKRGYFSDSFLRSWEGQNPNLRMERLTDEILDDKFLKTGIIDQGSATHFVSALLFSSRDTSSDPWTVEQPLMNVWLTPISAIKVDHSQLRDLTCDYSGKIYNCRLLDIISIQRMGIYIVELLNRSVLETFSPSPDNRYILKQVAYAQAERAETLHKDLLKLNHANITAYYAIGATTKKHALSETCCKFFLQEYCGGGSLRRRIEKEHSISIEQIHQYSSQILSGLHYLHSLTPRFLVHTDLKSDNIFLSHDLQSAKIGDLDDPKQLDFSYHQSLMTGGARGTTKFMSPELVRLITGDPDSAYGRTTDIWSFGCVVLEMLTKGEFGFAGADGVPYPTNIQKPDHSINQSLQCYAHDQQIKDILLNGGAPIVPQDNEIPQTLHDFIKQCLTLDPKYRPHAQDLLVHPFITSIELFQTCYTGS